MGFAVSITATALIIALPFNRPIMLMVVNSESTKNQVRDERDGPIVVSGESGLPDANVVDPKNDKSAFMELVFVFVWTAMASAVTSLLSLIWVLIDGNRFVLVSQSLPSDMLQCAVLAAIIYTALQLLTALKTVYQVALIFQSAASSTVARNTKNYIADNEPKPEHQE